MNSPRVVISGASGLVGSALTRALEADGVEVVRLVRRPAQSAAEIQWSPGTELDPAAIAGSAAVVNLSGASIGRLPWTPSYRKTLVSSRLHATQTIANALNHLGTAAPHFISASAVGFYGDRPGETLTERSTAGHTFLAELCTRWEGAALTAGPHTRVALLRTAPILHREGVLKPLVTLTKCGLSGPLSRGTQVWPWISLDDEIRAIQHIIRERLTGPINLCGPVRASANDIGHAIADTLGRPFLLRAPAWALRLGLGRDAADSLLLADAATEPDRLQSTGFVFRHASAEEAVEAALGVA